MSVEVSAFSAGAIALDGSPCARQGTARTQRTEAQTRIFLKVEKIIKQNRCRADW
jgi:hypothetical protein